MLSKPLRVGRNKIISNNYGKRKSLNVIFGDICKQKVGNDTGFHQINLKWIIHEVLKYFW